MDDMNYIRKLAGLPINESHFDPQTDADIDLHLIGWSPSDKEMAYDALEILRNKGREGITGAEWANLLSSIHAHIDRPTINAFLKKLVTALRGSQVERGGAGFVWVIEGTAEAGPDHRDYAQADENDPAFQAANMQTKAASIIMAFAKRLGAQNEQITLGGLARHLGGQTGMPVNAAAAYVHHVIDANPKMFVKIGDGVYRFDDPVQKGGSAMATFRNIASTGKLPGQE